MLAACGFGAVDVGEHRMQPGAARVCADLVTGLPEVVDDAVRREIDPPQPGVAAWGQPPIILRCGVPEPTGLDPTSAVLDVSGVGWRALDGEGGTFFYSDDRAVVVEVAVPDDYAPEAQVLVDLADAVLGSVPGVSAGPAGGAAPSAAVGRPAPGSRARRPTTRGGTSTTG